MYDEAISLLQCTAARFSDAKIFRLIGDICFTHKQDDESATAAYSAALAIDPEDEEALLGMQNVQARPGDDERMRAGCDGGVRVGGTLAVVPFHAADVRYKIEDASMNEGEEELNEDTAESSLVSDEVLVAQWADMDLEMLSDDNLSENA